jgi:hypothetical protein
LARSTAIYTVDDITGEPAHETVSFAFDGVAYEIDLTAEHADQLRDLLDRYIRHGRRTGGRRLRPRLVTNPVRVLAEPAPRSSRATKRPQGSPPDATPDEACLDDRPDEDALGERARGTVLRAGGMTQRFFSSSTTSDTDDFASPKSIVVFGSVNSSLSTPANPVPSDRFTTITDRLDTTSSTGMP